VVVNRDMINTFIDKRNLETFAAEAEEMMSFDPYLSARLSDSEIEGLKVWEYGRLLSFIRSFRGLRVLDVGPGDSTFCLFLSKKGARVITIDYPQPFAPDKEGFRLKCRGNGVAVNCGTMARMPYKDAIFDLVTCISTIEHLDTDAGWKPVPSGDFIAATKQSLQEMARVLRKGGYLYLTSDAYDPQLQQTDNWSLAPMYDGIGAAYNIREIEDIFVETLKQASLTFVNGYDYRSSLVLDDEMRSNYRGRYFTTFAVLAQKGGRP
jgi:SAM-dependent methyltransferase